MRLRSPMAVTVMVMVMVVFILLTAGGAGSASASTYRWNVDADGDWTNPANWTLIAGPAGAGYPNAADDVAQLHQAITAARTITIPDGVTITVGTLAFDSSQAYTLTSGTGTLSLNVANAPALITIASTGGSADHIIDVPVQLQKDSLVTINAASRLTISRVISSAGGTRGLTLNSNGIGGDDAVLRLAASESNTFTGPTGVVNGTLELAHPDGSNAIPGSLGIGTSGRVRLINSNQIADSPIHNNLYDVGVSGVFEMNDRSETIRSLHVDGLVSIGEGTLTVDDLTLKVSEITSAGAGRLVLRGNVKVTGRAVVAAPIDLDGDVRTFSYSPPPPVEPIVEDGRVASPALPVALLTLSGAISNGSLTFWGPAIFEMTGTESNTYTGATTVLFNASLRLGKVSGAPAIRGPLLISSASVETVTDEQIDPAQVITIDRAEMRIRAAQTIGPVTMTGGRVALGSGGSLRPTAFTVLPFGSPSVLGILGEPGPSGIVIVDGPVIANVAATAHFEIFPEIAGTGELIKQGDGVMRLLSIIPKPFTGQLSIVAGIVQLGTFLPAASVSMTGGALIGNGTVGAVSATGGLIALGLSPGEITSGSIELGAGVTYRVDVNGGGAGTFDRWLVSGTVALNDAAFTLVGTLNVTEPMVLILNDGADPVVGTFAGLPQDAEITLDGKTLKITYHGGDGNDVALMPVAPTPLTYVLAEGATGQFFDTDILIANPNTEAAPIALTFLKEDGTTVEQTRVVAAQSHLTIHVDELDGLEATTAATTVRSEQGLPLAVERTMFWDQSRYGGHTSAAVEASSTSWAFAEGAQGFFDTYLLIANPGDTPADITLTFLREGELPFVATRPVGARSRLTVHAGEFPELHNRSFGIAVGATQPVNAERVTYFGTTPTRLWGGGQGSAGVTQPSTNWFLAEGATGPFFDTFILLGNAQDVPAQVNVQFLLDTGETVTTERTVPAKGRVTIPVDDEPDARLQAAALSTIVTSDVPIVAERSMYWPTTETSPWGEAHHAVGLTATATRWGLAEGRVGGAFDYKTYILLANPSSTQADVTVTYLRENGAPIVTTKQVAPTSRLTIGVADEVQDLQDELFGVEIVVTNGVGIAVERALYWNSNGIFFAGGTDATGTRLP